MDSVFCLLLFWLVVKPAYISLLFRVATGDEVKNLLNLFITTGHEPAQIASDLASQLRHVRDVASKSLFFKAHSVSGSNMTWRSILIFIVHWHIPPLHPVPRSAHCQIDRLCQSPTRHRFDDKWRVATRAGQSDPFDRWGGEESVNLLTTFPRPVQHHQKKPLVV